LPRISEANGRFPTANQLVRRPGSTTDFALRTTFGILLSNDGAKSWDWVCEQAVGFSSSSDPPIQYSQGGSILVGTFIAASMSTDGCQWDSIGIVPKKFVSDITVRKDRPTTGLVLISPFLDSEGGNALYDTRLFEITDDGKSGSEVHAFDQTLLSYGVETAGAAMPKRVYVTAGRNVGSSNFPVLLVSDDDGVNFVERPIPTDPMKERSIYIAGVDPTNPDRVYLRTTGSQLDEGGANTTLSYNRLWVTEDAGKSWKPILTVTGNSQQALAPLLGFALSDDGSKIYAGGPLAGLNVASRSDFQFQKTSDLAVECLAMFDGVLWACATFPFALGTTMDDGKNFTPVLVFQENLKGPRTCSATSTFSTVATDDGGLGCLNVWPPVRDLLRLDAGARPDAGTGTMGGGGCSCDSAADGPVGWIGAAFGMFLTAAAILRMGKSKKPRA
jgi:hypothetical protein